MATQSNSSSNSVGTSFKLGRGGPVMVANAGGFEFRDSDGVLLTTLKVGTASDPAHAVGLSQLQGILTAFTAGSSFQAALSDVRASVATKLDANGTANALTVTPTGGTVGSLPDILASLRSLATNAASNAATISGLVGPLIASKLNTNGSANALTVRPSGYQSDVLLPDLFGAVAFRADLISAMDATLADMSTKLASNGVADALTITPTGGNSVGLANILGSLSDKILSGNAGTNAAVLAMIAGKLAPNGSANALTIDLASGTSGLVKDVLATFATGTQLSTAIATIQGSKLDANGIADHLYVTPTGGTKALLPDVLAALAAGGSSNGSSNSATVSYLTNKLDANGSANALTVTPTGGTNGLLTDILASKLNANGAADALTVAPTGGTRDTLPNVLSTFATNTALQTLSATLTASKLNTNGSANALTVTPTGGSLGVLPDVLAGYSLKTDLLAVMNATVIDLSSKVDANGSVNALTVQPPGGTVANVATVLAALDPTSSSFQSRIGAIFGAIASPIFNGPFQVNAAVGFNGNLPSLPQALAAPLATDGTATNAQICTALNAIRAALVVFGLGQ